MNRYLLAALYVMAGCAVTIPLKAQTNGEVWRGERCRLLITSTVKVISVYVAEEDKVQDLADLPPDYFRFPIPEVRHSAFSFHKTVRISTGSLCRTSHKIRAPGKL